MPNFLFSLVPIEEHARAILNDPHNVEFYDILHIDGKLEPALSFDIDRVAKTKGRFVSFGRHEENDVRLPKSEGEAYKNHHFFFYLAPSTGELILRDTSPKRTEIEVQDATPDEENLYRLQGEPRVRVIPRNFERLPLIRFGKQTTFQLMWRNRLSDCEQQKALIQRAKVIAETGMTLTVEPEPKGNCSGHCQGTDCPLPNTQLRRPGLRSNYAPTAKSSRSTNIDIHRYGVLGQGGFGVVSKVVDLRTGELWALKEFARNANGHRLRDSFKQEVEILAKLRHEHIVQLEHFQDFKLGGRFQVFFPIYDGNLTKLLPQPGQHDCYNPPTTVPAWALRMVDQVLGALDYLHSQGVVHRDIKPANILINYRETDPLPHFYVADFGLATFLTHSQQKTGGGTWHYLAPDDVEIPNEEADMWAFGVTLGEVLGYWCHLEAHTLSADQWGEKQLRYGMRDLLTVEDVAEFRKAETDSQLLDRWQRRLQILAAALPPVFSSFFGSREQRLHPGSCRQLARLFAENFFERRDPRNDPILSVCQLDSGVPNPESIPLIMGEPNGRADRT